LISIFAYDNQTFIVESFADTTVHVKVVTDENCLSLTNLESVENYQAGKREIPRRGSIPQLNHVFELELKPHSFLVLKMNMK
jgi:hypothetical protein